MSQYQQKIRKAKLLAAKARPKSKQDLSHLYVELNKLYDVVSEALSRVEEKSEQTQDSLLELNNTLVGAMQSLGEKERSVIVEAPKGPSSVSVSNLSDIETKVTIEAPRWLDGLEEAIKAGTAKDDQLQEATKNLANIADQLGTLEPSKQGQTPDDFVPFRRVIRVGKRLEFDDASWGGARGGGATLDKTGLATEAKQDDTITAIENISITPTPDKATLAYSVVAISDDGTYKYFFFEDASLNYYIMRKHKTNKVFTYTKGTGGYSAVYVSASAGPSGSPTWASYGNTF